MGAYTINMVDGEGWAGQRRGRIRERTGWAGRDSSHWRHWSGWQPFIGDGAMGWHNARLIYRQRDIRLSPAYKPLLVVFKPQHERPLVPLLRPPPSHSFSSLPSSSQYPPPVPTPPAPSPAQNPDASATSRPPCARASRPRSVTRACANRYQSSAQSKSSSCSTSSSPTRPWPASSASASNSTAGSASSSCSTFSSPCSDRQVAIALFSLQDHPGPSHRH